MSRNDSLEDGSGHQGMTLHSEDGCGCQGMILYSEDGGGHQGLTLYSEDETVIKGRHFTHMIGVVVKE